MAGSFESLAGPSYISSRSADVILSDVRPIKLKLEALRCMNVLLDEFLYKILNVANTLSTDKLKAGLNKILPTALGKDAVLEAELELKAYWERNTPHKPSSQDFDLQWSFELLRLKCEAYSTMNDNDEDAEVERKLNERMQSTGATGPPHPSLMAPAALYMTAILEHVCQHVLSNVSRVAARDSSRTLATVNDLFVALCEDDCVYTMFRTMKVYEQIEALSKMQKPRRTRSMSTKGSIDSFSPSRAASPASESMSTRLRVSSEAASAAVMSQLGSGRASHDKPRIKLFGTRSSSDHDRTETPASFDEDAKKSSSFDLMDEAALQEFDELMRTSQTMKVSLTPDRLKTMEVYKQEKRRAKGQEPENDPFLTVGTEVQRAVSARRAQARLVDAIKEDEEPSPVKAQPPSPSGDLAIIVPRTRQTSLHANASPLTAPPTVRTRSVTISAPQPLGKKRSVGQIRPAMPHVPSPILTPKRENSITQVPHMLNGRPPRSRRVARNRESMDLDDIMGREEEEVMSPPMTPASRRENGKPHISKSARDLIDFLDEGPPVELEPPSFPNFNASMVSLASSKSTSGRLHRMMSKLALGGSNEKISGRSSTTSDPRRSPNMYSAAPPTPYLPSSLASRQGRPMPAVIVATPPPPPSMFTGSFSAESSPSLSGNERHEAPESPRQPNAHRSSIIRKAVPTWDVEKQSDGAPQQSQIVTAPPVDKPRSKPSSPLDEFPPVPTTINAVGHARGDTYPGKNENGVLTARSEPSSAATSPITSPSATTPSSPVASLRRYSPRQASLNSVVASTSSVPSVVPSISQAQHPHQLSMSPEPEPEHEHQTRESSSASTLNNSENSPAVMGPISGLTFDDAHDLRRLLSVATTADECRLLVDMFLVKSGYPVLTDINDHPIIVPQTSKLHSPNPEDEASKIGALNEDIERSLVMHYLGGFDDSIPEPTPSVLQTESTTPEPDSSA